MFEVALHSLVSYSIKVSKPNNDSHLTEGEYDCPVALDVFGKSVKDDIQDIRTYTQQLGMAQEFHPEDIKLLWEVVKKYFLWHLEYPFQENDLELKAYISEALKKPIVPINKKPHWVLQNWDEIMAFMKCGMYLDREVYTARDLSDPGQKEIGGYLQTPRNKGKGSCRAANTSTKTTFTTKSATKWGTLLQQQKGDKDSGEKDKKEDRNNQQGQRIGRNDPDNIVSDSSSDSRSSSASLVRSILRLQNNNQRGQYAKSVEQER